MHLPVRDDDAEWNPAAAGVHHLTILRDQDLRPEMNHVRGKRQLKLPFLKHRESILLVASIGAEV